MEMELGGLEVVIVGSKSLRRESLHVCESTGKENCCGKMGHTKTVLG
jgi:hypothetical protein